MALDKDFFSIVRPKICIWLTTVNSIGDKYLLRLLVFMKRLNLAEFNEAFLLEKMPHVVHYFLQIMNIFTRNKLANLGRKSLTVNGIHICQGCVQDEVT